jgi:ADP-ribose pyrophosphatase
MASDEERLWKQVGDDEVVYDGWLKIHRRTYRLPDGRTVEWDMHAAGPTVAVLALTRDQDLVMVRQFRPGPDRVVLTLPGGMLDPGETPEEAARRELREETGFDAGTVDLAVSAIANASPFHRHVVIARDCLARHALDLDDYEDCEPVVMEVEAVRNELRAGRMTGSEQAYLALDHAGLL